MLVLKEDEDVEVLSLVAVDCVGDKGFIFVLIFVGTAVLGFVFVLIFVGTAVVGFVFVLIFVGTAV